MAITNRFASEDYVAEQNFLINEKLDVLQNNAILFTPQTLRAQERLNLGAILLIKINKCVLSVQIIIWPLFICFYMI